jgi:hypothetical protein
MKIKIIMVTGAREKKSGSVVIGLQPSLLVRQG